MPDMDLDASDSDLPDLVLSSAAHSRSFASTVHGSTNRNTGLYHPGHWRSESGPSGSQAPTSNKRRRVNSVTVCSSLNFLQQWKLIGRIATVRRWCCLGLRSPPYGWYFIRKAHYQRASCAGFSKAPRERARCSRSRSTEGQGGGKEGWNILETGSDLARAGGRRK